MDKLLSVEELSEILGIRKSTIYSWTSKRKIPHVKPSKRLVRFRLGDITDFISKKTVKPDSQTPIHKNSNKVKAKGSASVKPSVSENQIESYVENAKRQVLGS